MSNWPKTFISSIFINNNTFLNVFFYIQWRFTQEGNVTAHFMYNLLNVAKSQGFLSKHIWCFPDKTKLRIGSKTALDSVCAKEMSNMVS